MTLTTLMIRSMVRFWRTNLGVMLGVALASAVITGALLVGDSMRHTLEHTASQRLGGITHGILAGDRFITTQLTDSLGDNVAGAVLIEGVVSTPDGSKRADQVQVTGIDSAFIDLMNMPGQFEPGMAFLNEPLADRLGAKVGDTLVIRVPKPSALPIDAALVNASKPALALRVEVQRIVPADQGGRFSLRAEQRTPMNLFVHDAWLADQLEVPGRVNAALMSARPGPIHPTLDDLELSLKALPDGRRELATPRVFLDASIEQDLADLPGQRLLTYLVNTIRLGDKQSPYAMITAASELGDLNLADDEIALNSWLAEDLGASVGDTVTLAYYLPDEGDQLIEATATMTVKHIVAIQGEFSDRTLTPDFPGLAEADQLSRWDAGPAIDRSRIRDKDEAYWDTYRATPKAFINLHTGQRLWANRFGTLTAIRMQGDVSEAELLDRIDAVALGVSVTDIKAQADAAAVGTVDFGHLFLSLSGFIIIAAVALAAMLFAMSAEQRARQLGTMLAVGLTRQQVARLMLYEGAAVAVLGASIGLLGGVGYAYIVADALSGVWSGAVAGTAVLLHMTPTSLIAGPLSAVVISLLAMIVSVRGLTRRAARELMAGGVGKVSQPTRYPRGAWPVAATACFAVAGYLVVTNTDQTGMRAALIGFAAGAACFAGCLLLFYALMLRRGPVTQRVGLVRGTNSLASLNLTRRRGRTIAGVFMLGAGLFLVYAVSGFHLGISDDPDNRDSGTGGFALIVESSQPIAYDLNTALGRDHYTLSEQELAAGSVVPIRVSGGDDASCLNLNQTPTPRLLGVDPQLLSKRGAFRFFSGEDASEGWSRLTPQPDASGAIPVIADANTAQWALKLSVGDTLTLPDATGQPFTIKLVATIENSILQGSLILHEQAFKANFPATSGYRLLLVDSQANQPRDDVAALLQEVLIDEGVTVTPTNERLAEYNRVQNTYLAVFQALGGLGVLLGALGLGVVTSRNLLERRSELALLSAVGLSRIRIARIVLTEHAVILLAGLTLGSLSAWIATLHTNSATSDMDWGLALAYIAPMVAGLAAILIGLLPALSGRLTDALRND